MEIILLDRNKNMTDAWRKWFGEEVSIVNESFEQFMYQNNHIDGIVSPANSFGIMDGGYDKAIIDFFGEMLMRDVQRKIREDWYGEQPVGTSISVPIHGYSITLIHTPTMRLPEPIVDYRIVYQCMRTTLMEAVRQNLERIVVPAFGAATGRVPCEVAAEMMYRGYRQVKDAQQ